MVDFNNVDSGEQKSTLIPENTVVPVRIELSQENTVETEMNINGEKYPSFLLRRAELGMCYMPLAFRVIGGPYMNRLIWKNVNLVMDGESITDGQKKGISFSQLMLKGILLSNARLGMSDVSDKSKKVLAETIPGNDYSVLHGMNAVVKVEIKSGTNGYDDKNDVAPWSILTMDDGSIYKDQLEFFTNKTSISTTGVKAEVSAAIPTFSPDTDKPAPQAEKSSSNEMSGDDLPQWGS